MHLLLTEKDSKAACIKWPLQLRQADKEHEQEVPTSANYCLESERHHTLISYTASEGSARIQAAGGPDPGRIPAIFVLILPHLLGGILWQQRRPQAGPIPGWGLSLWGPTHMPAWFLSRGWDSLDWQYINSSCLNLWQLEAPAPYLALRTLWDLHIRQQNTSKMPSFTGPQSMLQCPGARADCWDEATWNFLRFQRADRCRASVRSSP